jgi:hypothetical protein
VTIAMTVAADRVKIMAGKVFAAPPETKKEPPEKTPEKPSEKKIEGACDT